MVMQTGLLLSCSEEVYDEKASPLIESHVMLSEPSRDSKNHNHHLAETTSFMTSLKKSSDLIRLSDSVSSLNLSLSIQKIQPVKCSGAFVDDYNNNGASSRKLPSAIINNVASTTDNLLQLNNNNNNKVRVNLQANATTKKPVKLIGVN